MLKADFVLPSAVISTIINPLTGKYVWSSLLIYLITNQLHFKPHNNHNFSDSMQVVQQYGGDAVTIATADKQRRSDDRKTSVESSFGREECLPEH